MIGVLEPLITIAFTIACAKIDSDHINKGEHIRDHKSRWIMRACFVFMISLFDPFSALASGLLFTALFDHILNYLRGLPIMYIGHVAKWDKFFNKRKYLFFFVKILCLISSIYIYFKILTS